MEKQIMWAVYGPDGDVYVSTLAYYRWASIDKQFAAANWKRWYRKGYRCKKVSVTIEPITPKP